MRGKKIKIKKINKEISVFNNKLKKAVKKGIIDKSTYQALLIDKPQKDFYRKTIYTKKQFNKFKTLLRKLDNKSLKPSKRNFKSISENFNELAQTRFEKQIIKEQLKKTKYLKDTFGHHYNDYIMGVAMDTNKDKYYKFLKRIIKMEFDIDSIEQRYIDNWEKVYKQRFGHKPPIAIKDPQIIREMLKRPNLSIDYIYTPDPYAEDNAEEQEIIDNLKELRKMVKNRKNNAEEI